ncbi:unnamed protein product [Moneuplotes crassus]|uniref:Uncharacterized protein n=1 Tax=Euplotes crassus TaxID=5936 RepID=A0AAD1XW51_EUPCR|nr:unnamed protein product [Moneuplotes crassus]
MGGMMSCLRQTPDTKEEKEVHKHKMTDEDKAVLNLKKTNRVLGKQIQELENQTEQFWNKAKEEKRAKNDNKAVSLMKRRKLYMKYLDAARGKQQMIEETLQNIKSAKIDVGVKEALEAGQEVIDDLSNKASIEDFENILERQKETIEQQEELQQLLDEAGIDDDEVMDDINELEAELFGKEMDKVKVPKDRIEADEEEEDVRHKEKSKKDKQVLA